MGEFSLKMTDTIDYDRLKEMAKGAEIHVGYLDSQPHPNSEGESMAGLARKLTYGMGGKITFSRTKQVKGERVTENFTVNGIPPRPFLDKGIEHYREDVNKEIQSYFQDKMAGKKTSAARVALACVNAIKKFVISSGFWKSKAPNSSTTIQAKGSDTPLVDSGVLIGGLTHIVKEDS